MISQKCRCPIRKPAGQARLLKAQAKNDVKDGKYDEAIAKLNQCLEQKKKALSSGTDK